jgi:hypothetical protein
MSDEVENSTENEEEEKEIKVCELQIPCDILKLLCRRCQAESPQ